MQLYTYYYDDLDQMADLVIEGEDCEHDKVEYLSECCGRYKSWDSDQCSKCGEYTDFYYMCVLCGNENVA